MPNQHGAHTQRHKASQRSRRRQRDTTRVLYCVDDSCSCSKTQRGFDPPNSMWSLQGSTHEWNGKAKRKTLEQKWNLACYAQNEMLLAQQSLLTQMLIVTVKFIVHFECVFNPFSRIYMQLLIHTPIFLIRGNILYYCYLTLTNRKLSRQLSMTKNQHICTYYVCICRRKWESHNSTCAN